MLVNNSLKNNMILKYINCKSVYINMLTKYLTRATIFLEKRCKHEKKCIQLSTLG